MTTYIVSVATAFLVAVVATPLVAKFALRFGALDRAGRKRRKVHLRDTPRLGGIAIVLAFFGPICAIGLFRSDVGSQFVSDPFFALCLIGGGLMIAALGVVDDLVALRPAVKLVGQTVVAVLVVTFGFDTITIDLLGLVSLEGPVGVAVSVLWIVGIINAINLIDGLDGLASGICLLGVTPVAVVALLSNNVHLAVVCLALVGSLAGFLLFNFHPARIFLGDSGSMFLGFILGVITLYTSSKTPFIASFAVPILALGVPIFDTALTVVRRSLNGAPIFGSDREHIHHRLLHRGMSHRGAVLALYGLAALLGLASVLLVFYRHHALIPAILLVLAFSLILARLGGWKLIESGKTGPFSRRARRRELRVLGERLAEAPERGTLHQFVGELPRLLDAVEVNIGEVLEQATRDSEQFPIRAAGSERIVAYLRVRWNDSAGGEGAFLAEYASDALGKAPHLFEQA